MTNFEGTSVYNIIYIYGTADTRRQGQLNVGVASVNYNGHSGELEPNCDILNRAANEAIAQNNTDGNAAVLEYATLAVLKCGEKRIAFGKAELHEWLGSRGFKQPDTAAGADSESNDWFVADKQSLIDAIKQFTDKGTCNIAEEETGSIIGQDNGITLREEQLHAVEQTLACFKRGKKMLWDAKMRFGKTLCALEVVKRGTFRRTLILTHRPVVREGWFDDFEKIGFTDCLYGSKARKTGVNAKNHAGEDFGDLEHHACADKNFRYIYFASMQDLRGSKRVNKSSRLDKNNDIFSTKWDLLIIDEAHEGISTKLGKEVLAELQSKRNVKTLYLSGTPYNIAAEFEANDVFRWDYTMEQRAKAEWEVKHPGEPNPYEPLATMNVITIDLGRNFKKYREEGNGAFAFHEFLRVDDTNGEFVHEADVRSFLHIISNEQSGTVSPFAVGRNADAFKHTLWSVPGVKAAKRLAEILSEQTADNAFSEYNIVNVAGEGESTHDREDIAEMSRLEKNALNRVKEAIRSHERTITLSCGRLTVGASVPEWTGIMMLSGGADAGVARYMQTMFRCQTPYSDGRIKQNCYVFDFSPERTLTILDQYINNTVDDSVAGDHMTKVAQFLSYCRLVCVRGSKAVRYGASEFVRDVNQTYSDNLIRKGFRDSCLYGNLENLRKQDLQLLDEVAKAISMATAESRSDNRDAVTRGKKRVRKHAEDAGNISEKQSAENAETSPSSSTALSRRQKILAILNQISARFPMMIYGTTDKIDALTLDTFIKQIDEDSWKEFMPRGITMKMFMRLRRFYREDVFVATAKAIAERVKAADKLPVVERINEIADILSDFCYPDKETALTPWRLVNMHMSDTLGGYDFWDKKHEKLLREPRFVYHGEVTDKVFMNPKSKILDICSKTGLYALYMAYGIYKIRSSQSQGLFDTLSDEEAEQLWTEVIEKNIFVLCKTKMAERITRRTLTGFRDTKANVKCLENLTGQIMVYKKKFARTVANGKTFWNANDIENMKFDAIISNPPYQVNIGEQKDNYGIPLYNQFMETAKEFSPNYISMIMPSRWFTGGRGLDKFRKDMLTDKRLRKIFDFVDSKDCFPTVDISGGVGYFLWDAHHNGNCEFTNTLHGKSRSQERRLDEYPVFIRNNDALSVIEKVMSKSKHMLSETVSGQTPFGFVTTYRGNESPFAQSVELKSSGATTYVTRESIKKNSQWTDLYKVIFSKATCEHAGTPDRNGQYRVLSSVMTLQPGVICTQSYLVGNVFENEAGANNFTQYLKTKFLRYLMLQTITSQDLSSDKFMFVPIQDFTNASDIDWTAQLEEIDRQLYAKYSLDKEEIEIIENTVKSM